MMRVLVFGNSGSGKSTYARTLADQEGVPHLDLDSIVWEPHQIAVLRVPETIRQSLEQFLATHDSWVIEGCYGELIDAAALQCTELVFLNPGLAACLSNNARRTWEPHKYASADEQNAMLPILSAWVTDYYHRTDQWSYQAHRRIFDAHSGVKIEHTRLVDRTTGAASGAEQS
jgi:adenylate kinase family enzyme